MTSERLDRYFVDETADYLGQLDILLAGEGQPDLQDLLRLTAGARGSARMAGADRVSNLTARLEGAAQALVDDRLSWSDQLREIAQITVEQIRNLLNPVGHWEAEEDERVRVVLEQWDREVGGEWQDAQAVPIETLLYDAVPIASLFYDDEGPHVLDGSPLDAQPGSNGVVPIEFLLLRGQAAIREAIALRPAFESIAREQNASDRGLPDLVAELFDLLELGSVSEVQDA